VAQVRLQPRRVSAYPALPRAGLAENATFVSLKNFSYGDINLQREIEKGGIGLACRPGKVKKLPASKQL